jgi:predicted dinucleotide-binding enzyme
MKIGIIGAGHIGSALTRRFTDLGHDVVVANSRGPETLQDLARTTGATAVDVSQAAQDREVVVVTIPLKNVPDLPDGILDGAAPNVAVIDTCNYYPQQRDGRIVEIEGGETESEWVARQLGHTVVKAFNNIYAQHLAEHGSEAGDPARYALPISGDDLTAKSTVVQLIEDLGFDVVDVGPLSESWRQQPGTAAYGTDLKREDLERTIREQQPGRPAEFTA